MEVHGTPRRLAVLVHDLAAAQTPQESKVRKRDQHNDSRLSTEYGTWQCTANKLRLLHAAVELHGTPRRLAVLVHDLAAAANTPGVEATSLMGALYSVVGLAVSACRTAVDIIRLVHDLAAAAYTPGVKGESSLGAEPYPVVGLAVSVCGTAVGIVRLVHDLAAAANTPGVKGESGDAEKSVFLEHCRT